MNKKLFKELKEKLLKERQTLTKELESFAEKDPHLKEDWDSRYPHFDGEVGSAALEKAADEVEEYETRLPIEFNLETRLRDIDLALEKIEKSGYGKCEKCGKEISEKRLKIYPEARFCLGCMKR